MIALERFNEAVELSLDDSGIDELIDLLQGLKGMKTHVHMMTPAWGGKELSEAIRHGELVNHLIIYSVGCGE